MEKGEAAQKEVLAAQQVAAEAKKIADTKLAELDAREKNFKAELAKLESDRAQLAEVVEESARDKYERLLRNKGSNVVVGITHSSCGGCHMKLNRGTVVQTQAAQEIVTCTNCGRILYFTRDMDLAIAD